MWGIFVMARKRTEASGGARWPEYLLVALRVLAPPERLTVTQWADKYRVLDSMSAAMPGRWTTSITPYLSGIMDEFNNPYTTEIIFVKCTQIGGTEAMLNMLLSIIHTSPTPTVLMFPSERLARSTSLLRIQPALRATPELRERWREDLSDMLMLLCTGMPLTLIGGHSVPASSSAAYQNVFVDEVDKFPAAQKREADTVTLLRERSKTFLGQKFVEASTPTTTSGRIWRDMMAADEIRHYFVPCPHCNEFIELQFQHLKFPKAESGLSYVERAELASYVCQNCGAVIEERDKQSMLRRGEWRPIKQRTARPKSVAFWMG